MLSREFLSTLIDKKDDTFLSQNIKGMMMTLIARWNTQMDNARAHTEFAEVRPADIRVFAQLRGRTVKLSQIHCPSSEFSGMQRRFRYFHTIRCSKTLTQPDYEAFVCISCLYPR